MNSKAEVELLMNEMVPFAKQMLVEYGEFIPFGCFSNRDGTIVHVGGQGTGEELSNQDIAALLEADFRESARREEIRASALVCDVKLRNAADGSSSDAIQINLDHVDGYSAEVFYPYQLNAECGNVVFDSIVAQEGHYRIFNSDNSSESLTRDDDGAESK